MSDELKSWPLTMMDGSRLLFHIAGTNPPQYGIDEKLEQLWREGQQSLKISTCPCGAPLEQPTTGRHRKFCSDECRRKADALRRLVRNCRPDLALCIDCGVLIGQNDIGRPRMRCRGCADRRSCSGNHGKNSRKMLQEDI